MYNFIYICVCVCIYMCVYIFINEGQAGRSRPTHGPGAGAIHTDVYTYL